LTRRRPKKALLPSAILAGGAGLAALIWGCGGGDSEIKGSDAPIAKVGDRVITMDDLVDKMGLQYSQVGDLVGMEDVKQKRQILNVYIDELCWVALGKKLGYEKSASYLRSIEIARDHLLGETVTAEYVRPRAQPTEEQIRRFYEENLKQFQVPERVLTNHIMTKTREESEEVRRLLQAGGDWDELAARHSVDPTTASRKGSVGAVDLDSDILGLGKVPEFNRAVLALDAGEISAPFQSSRGWHVAKVRERRPAGARPLDEVRDAISDRLLRENFLQLKRTVLDSIQSAIGVEIYEEGLDAYMVAHLSEEDLLAEARRETDPMKRIRLYGGFLDRFPSSASCPESQFMVGFIQSEELGDKEKAREAFEAILKKYPESELAQSARWMLDNLEKNVPAIRDLNDVRRRAAGSSGG
jgi:peptidyl-prolyl cis-trans isomerase C